MDTVCENLVGLVTGGASGLGQAVVENWVRQGGRVVFCDLQEDKGKELENKLGKNCMFVRADVSSEEDVEQLMSAVKERYGRLDVLINNAGIAKFGPIYNAVEDKPHSLDDFKKLINTNLVGNFNVTRLAVPLMAKNNPDGEGQRGIIINSASMAALEPLPHLIAYTASKGGIVSMTAPMAKELAPLGIRVLSIAPSMMLTGMTGDHFDPQKLASSIAAFPSRIGQPEDFAKLVQSIIANPYLNGCVIPLNAGGKPTHRPSMAQAPK